MTALATRKAYAFSKEAQRSAAAHKRALAAPMTQIPMVADPHLEQVAALAALQASRAQLERRACQYAAWIASKSGAMRLDPREYNARFDGKGSVYFACYNGRRAHEFAISIPAHVLAFDASAPALMIEGPQDDPAPAPRCDLTAGMDFVDTSPPLAIESAPAPLKSIREPRAKRAPAPKVKTFYLIGRRSRPMVACTI